MKGKISTKAIIITILTVVLLAIATTGTVLFLKDSGEAAAMEEQNTVGTLPVAGSDNQIEANTEQTVENEGENPEIVGETEQVETEQQTGETEQNENQAQGTETQTINTTPTQNTGVITEEPEPTTIEQERVISEETTLGWNNLSVSAGQANYTEREINYNNLKYTVNYYEDGELVHTEIIKGNSLGKEITEVEDRMKAEYYLDEENTTKLPITITENEKDNVIDIHYLIKKYSITFTAGENGSLEGTTEFIVPSGSKFGNKVTVPETKGNKGYCFDKWEPVLPEEDSVVTADATYKAIFGIDENGNNIPDYRDTYHKVTFTADENGSLNGTTEFSVLTGLTFGSKVTVPETKGNTGYCFDKWEPVLPAKDSKVTADATYKAIFATDENGNDIPDYRDTYHKVTFTADENGSLNGTTEFSVLTGLTFGSKVTVPETKGNTGYCFDKWEPVLPAKDSKVTADATYKAIFATDENGNDIPDYRDTYHKVTFTADENGSLNGTTEFSVLTGLTFGSKVTVPETKGNTGYCFDKWEPVLPAKDSKVTADATYKAIFATDENGNDIPDYRDTYHKVTFTADENGSLNGTTEFSVLTGLTFGSKVTVPETKGNTGYCFDKWEPVLPAKDSKVTADATYKAIFATDENGNDIPDYRDTYHKVTFTADENGSLNGTTEFSVLTGLTFGSKVTVPETKGNTGYCFDKWEPVLPEEDSVVTADATYKAIFATDENGNDIPDYRDTYHKVTFTADENGSLNGTTEFSVLTGLTFGSKVTVPETKGNTGYCFDKWEPVLPAKDSKVTADATYKAIFATDENGNDIPDYRDTYHKVTFTADENGSLNGTTEFSVLTGLTFGSKVTVPETKGNTGYCFDKWEPGIPAKDLKVTADATYKAIFAIDENGNDIPDYRDTYHTIIFISDENGSLNGETRFRVLTGLTFGSKVTVPTPVARDGYEFDKWEPSIPTAETKVEADAEYKAIFKAKKYKYTVTYWYNGKEGPTKEDTQPYGTKIGKDNLPIEDNRKYNGKEYNYKEITTSQGREYIIIDKNITNNHINVYYAMPEIQSEKTSKAYDSNGNQRTGNKIHSGDTIEYTIKVWNTGSEEQRIVITDNAPVGTEYVSGEMTKTTIVPANTSYDNAITMIFKVKVKEGATGTITNTVDLDKGPDATDPTIYEVIKQENIVVEKSVDKSGELEPGDTLKYTLTAKNSGDEKGTTVVRDKIPENTKLSGAITATGITDTITEERLAEGIALEVVPGLESKIEFSVTILEGAVGKEIKNQAFYDDKSTEEVINTVVKSIDVIANVGVEQQKQINYIILVDASNSMEGTRAKNAQKAINRFLNAAWTSTPNATVNIVEFASKYVIKSYTISKGGTFNFRMGMSTTENLYYTDLLAALKEGATKINTSKANVMIVLSDGEPFDIYDYNGGIMVPGANIGPAYLYGGGKPYHVEHDGNVIAKYVSDNIKSRGTTVYSIGFGSDANKPSKEAYKILAKLSSDGKVLTSDSADELTGNFKEIIYSEMEPVKIKINDKTYEFDLGNKQLDSNKKVVISYDGGKEEYIFKNPGSKGPLTYSEIEGNYKLTFDLTNYLNKKNLQIKYYVK